MSNSIEDLLVPLSAEAPCGVSLEDTPLLAGFDGYRLFGSDVRLPADTDWRDIRDRSYEALAQSKDLRVLAHLAAAVLRIDGIDALASTLGVAEAWLRDQWKTVFPGVEEDMILRKNALSCLADRMAVVDAVRRAPFVTHRQLGAYSLRHVELASGQLTATETDTNIPSAAQIEAALAGTPVEELQARAKSIANGMNALRNITVTMQTQGGFESAPDFAPLLAPLTRIDRMLTEHLQSRGEAIMTSGEGEGAAPGDGAGTVAVGNLRSRHDAIRAIDAVATYFRKNEPSSPVPLLLDRAKRLVSKSFLEVVEDIAPESLTQVRVLGGIKADE
jgi:type VI secretion system protein ImpA